MRGVHCFHQRLGEVVVVELPSLLITSRFASVDGVEVVLRGVKCWLMAKKENKSGSGRSPEGGEREPCGP